MTITHGLAFSLMISCAKVESDNNGYPTDVSTDENSSIDNEDSIFEGTETENVPSDRIDEDVTQDEEENTDENENEVDNEGDDENGIDEEVVDEDDSSQNETTCPVEYDPDPFID